MKNKNVLVLIFKILPTSFISRLFGYITRIPLPASILNPVIKLYSRQYNVKSEEIEYPEGGFSNFDSFFTRKLKKGIHEIDKSKNSIISPVDAELVNYDIIKGSTIIQAKGVDYTLQELLPSEKHKDYIGGSFITLYLSPGDYHRIHSPVSGKITGYFNIPGKLFPVRDYMVNGVKGLFAKNERVISYIDTPKGKAALCKIGAFNVGRITLSYCREVSNKTFRRKKEFFFPGNSRPLVKKGEELGIFHLGSTVILLFQKNMIKFEKLKKGEKIRLGQKIAVLK